MKKTVGAAVLVLALVATLGSSDDEDGGSGSAATQTTVSSEGSDTTGEGGTEGASSAGEADEVDDVVITQCGAVDSLGFATATIEVTNNSSQPSNYMIEIAFESADGSLQIGTGNALISGLGPDQKKVEEVSLLEQTEEQGMTCRVSSVDRYAA